MNFLQSIPVWDALEVLGITSLAVLLIKEQINPRLAKVDELFASLSDRWYITPKIIEALRNDTRMEITEEESRQIARAIVDRLTGAK